MQNMAGISYLLESVKEKTSLTDLSEQALKEAIKQNSILIIPGHRRLNIEGLHLTEHQVNLLQCAAQQKIKSVKCLVEESDCRELLLNSDYIDLGFLILCNPMAAQILITLLGQVYYDALKSGAKSIFKLRTNGKLNKIGELEYEDPTKRINIRDIEITDETMRKLLDKLIGGDNDQNSAI